MTTTTAAAADPAWLKNARELVGLKEIVGSRHEPKVLEFFKEAGHPEIHNDETAWCAAFANAMLRRAGYAGTGALNARSFLTWGTKREAPKPGCIVVFQRGNSGWEGHVAFFLRKVGDRVEVLGGNQSNSVSIARYPAAKVLGYRWPLITASKIIVPDADEAAPITSETVKAQPRKASASTRVEVLQRKLDRLGYHEVGEIDGKWGSRTAGACAMFMLNEGKPFAAPADGSFNDKIFAEVSAQADVAIAEDRQRPVGASRRNATATDLAPKIEAVRQSLWQRLVAKVTGTGAATGTVVYGVASQFSDVNEKISPIREFFASVPPIVWGLLVVGACVALYLSSSRTTDSTTADYNTGRIN